MSSRSTGARVQKIIFEKNFRRRVFSNLEKMQWLATAAQIIMKIRNSTEDQEKLETFEENINLSQSISITFLGNDFAAYLTEAMQRYKNDHGSVKSQAKALNTLLIHIFKYNANSIRYLKPLKSNIWLEVVIR